jgi:hypothetical protein
LSNTKTVRPYLDIKAQIEGRCSEILLLLGINPLAMATQITCPVAEHHAGRVSFRVNPVTNRYFCAHCQPKGASLVDLVIQLGKAGSFAAAADYLRAGLDIKPQKTPLQALGDMPDPLAHFITKNHGDYSEQTDDGDPESDIPLFEQKITAMLDAANPANLHPYSLHRRFAPLGARATDGGNLLIPARDHAGNLCALLQISLQGKHLVVSDGRLMGAASTLGQFKDARVIAATLDWESQVVLHTVYGGMPIIGYLTPDNALLAVDEFLTSATKEIWVFAGPSDVPELQAGMTLYANDNDLKLKWFSTKEPDFSIAYAKKLGSFPHPT